jgi:hypothetical protein
MQNSKLTLNKHVMIIINNANTLKVHNIANCAKNSVENLARYS